MDILSGGNDLGTLGLGLAIAGAAAGLFAAVLGRGAGVIMVSALFLSARSAGLMPETAMHLAIGTSFLCLVPLTLARTAAIKTSAISRRLVQPILLGLLLSAGALTLTYPLPGTTLVLIFAGVSVVAAVLTITGNKRHLGTGHRAIQAGVALTGTFLAGLTGLSGQTLTAPSLVAAGLSREAAEATAAGYAIPITMIGAAVAVIAGWDAHGLPRYSYGYVNLMAFAAAAPIALVTTLIGHRYADAIETKNLKMLFAAFAVFAAVRMVWSVAG